LADHVATAQIRIDSGPAAIWDALTNPAKIEKYMFGTRVDTDWKVGSSIRWSGEWQGKSYEDMGKILESEPERHLSYSHYSPLTGDPDIPENYHDIRIELNEESGGTTVTLTQDNNKSVEARQHSEENWQMMLVGLKKLVETE
jgi:uncharacterized protein YndB with AHSA1/START domain